MTQPNITPEGFRTAAYLATRQRIDAARSRSGKTLKRVTCNPPNVQCGGRCIPPNWDCRLKGQGADPQLRAVQTDPVGGLANIERGAKRIGKGIAKGSFSEIEGGKRAIVRGVVKAVPGDIQRKKELAAKLERQGARIAVGLAVVGAGLGIHNLLMKRNTLGYRDTVGANINNAVRLGVNKVLDATPIIKTERERKRVQAQTGIQAALMRQTNPVSKQLTNQLAKTGVSAADEDSRSNLINNLNKVYNNPELSGPQSDFNEWNRAHQRAFWSTTRKETGVGLATGERGSIFARPATDEFLTRQFNLQGDDTLTPGAIKDAISRNLETYKEDLANLAQQQGFKLQTVAGGKRVISRNDRRQFIKGVVQSSLPKGQANDSVRSAFTKHLEQTLSKNPDTLAGEIYRDTYRGFDDYYKTKATTIRAATAEPFLSQPLRQAGATETLLDANQSRAAFISGKRTAGPIHAELVLRQHHAEVVRKAPGGRFEVSDRVAVQAIQELTGSTVSAREAFRLLGTEHGFSNIRRAGGAVEPRRPGRRAQVQLSDRARQLREAARARGEEMSMEASIKAAKAELKRRGDALPPGLMRTATYLAVRADLRGEGKPCGASHIPKAHTCTKGAGAIERKERELYEKSATKAEKAYVEKHGLPKDTLSVVEAQLALEKESKAAPENAPTKSTGRGKKLALAAGGAALLAGGALAYKNRKSIAAAAGTLNTERKAQTERVVAELSKNTIKTLSRDDVDAGIAKLPKKFQEPVRQLVGDAKVSAAHLALKTKGGQITSVDVDNNFSNWKMPDGTLLSTGSVKDTLVIYNTKPQASIGGAQTFATQFRVDGEFDAKSASASRNATSVVSTVKRMFQSQMEQIPDNSIITAIPYANDKKGRQRRAIYQRYGFRQASASDERLFAMKTKGKFTKMKDSHLEQIADLIRNDTKLDKEDSRLGKPCGASYIPKAYECRKGRDSTVPDTTKLKVAAAIGGTVVATGLLAAIGVNQSKVSEYRSNVSDSAIKAETLAKTMMDEMRQNASTRLGKDLKDINGFEASVYNFKDSGHDRGFSSNDKAPHYFGQTPNSRGAVVMLSYADDNRFTRQGQGSYKMVKGGAFQEIWGEHDILPFANSISQPSRRSPDDITLKARDRVIKAAGPLGKGVKNVIKTKEALANFEYLQENINRRGHNPDAVRAAAFVVAQRRLTGKPVHLMSYSNGGNVASETLAILKEMGYKDVKVVNVAGPTFGVFKHSRDQMRTWVSRGDEFWSMGRNAAFQGSNVQFLRNSNIPHGLTAKTDPNNRENGANWKANFKARNSYLLDKQLQQEAHRFLTVDSRRSRELADEFIWRVAEKKPMEGDLDTLLGVRGPSMTTAYTQRRRRRDPAQADEWLRTEIEKHMIDKWYGGYNAKTIKNRQKQIQRDLQEQIHGKKATT